MKSILTTLALGGLFLLDFVSAVTKSPGCGKPLFPNIKTGGIGSSNKLRLTSDGIKRTYLLHLPRAYSSTRPHGLVFSFHGRADTATNQERLSDFSNRSLNRHMLAVYPEGVDGEWQGDPDAKTDDVKFTLDMLEQISKNYCIDLEKVYATGKSNGGGFAANILACESLASTKIAAFASFAGAYYQTPTNGTCKPATVPITCNPGRKPIPILEVHGSDDDVIAYNGGLRRGQCLPSVPHFMTAWARRNGLGARNESTVLKDRRVVRYEWSQGVNVHYRVEGMGHVWPDVEGNGDGRAVVDGTELAMGFFERWSLKNAKSQRKKRGRAMQHG